MSIENTDVGDGFAQEMYKDYILDIYKNPKNYGELPGKTHFFKENNSFCGDSIEIQLLIEDNIIKNSRFKGKGCVISTVSASLITEHIKNKPIDYVKNLKIEDISKLMNVNIISTRLKCASLPLVALIKSLGQKNDVKN